MSYSKLRGKIREVFGTERDFADALNVNTVTLWAKLTNKRQWKREEIERACIVLSIPINEVADYFFAQN